MVVTSSWETALFCYAILEVDSVADDEIINEAYRRLAALIHPKGRGTSNAASTEFHRLLQVHHALESDSARIRQTLDDLEAQVARASRDFLSQVRQLEDTKEACRAEFATLPTEGNPRLNDYISLLASSRGDRRPVARRKTHRRVCRVLNKEVYLNRAEARNEAARQAVHAQYILIHDARRELAVVNAKLARVRRERNGRFSGRSKAGVENKEEAPLETRKTETDCRETADVVSGYLKCVEREKRRRAWLVDDISSRQLQNGDFEEMVRVI